MNSTFDILVHTTYKPFRYPTPTTNRFLLKGYTAKPQYRSKTPKDIRNYTLDDFKFPKSMRISSPKQIKFRAKTPTLRSRGNYNGLCVKGKPISQIRPISENFDFILHDSNRQNNSIRHKLIEKRSKEIGSLGFENEDIKQWDN